MIDRNLIEPLNPMDIEDIITWIEDDDGKLHCVDGPAVIFSNGVMWWFINNIDKTENIEEWLLENNITYPFSEDTLRLFQMRWL